MKRRAAFNAITFAVMTVFSSGISMYAMAKIIQSLHLFDAAFHVGGRADRSGSFDASLGDLVADRAGVHLPRRFTSAIYNEVLQFFLIVAGFLPLVLAGAEERRRSSRT